MKRSLYRLSALLLLFQFVHIMLCAQASPTYIFKGRVADSATGIGLDAASIQVYEVTSKKFMTGKVSGDSGRFEFMLPAGSYTAEVNYTGYVTVIIKRFQLGPDHQTEDAGNIKLHTAGNILDEVVVQAEKSSMTLSLDKKIFNVGKDLANAGGSAADILSNIPSVSVDPEGAIKLRGSDNVRILIDGKPSGLVSFKGGSGLQQLQASMIDRVEIITNPSARYEAEGMAGILNIILKKDKRQGFNASFEVTTGYPTNLGAAANLNYRHKRINFFVNYGIAYRRQPALGSMYQELYERDTTFVLQQSTDATITGFNNNIRGGLDYYFSESSVLTASYLFRRSDASRLTDIRYDDYIFSKSRLIGSSARRQDEDEIEPNSEYSLIYKKSFAQKGHELTGEVKFLDNWENSDQTFTQRFFSPSGAEDPTRSLLQKSVNDEFEKQLLFQIDYIKPISREGKFEAGARSSFRDMTNDYIVTQQNASGGFDALPGLDNIFLYKENIHAVYGIAANKTNKFSYQAGIRAEWTDVKTVLKETNQENPRNYMNLFPSAHVTLELPKEHALQLSYSRRVRRPFYNDLSPFMTFSDSRNFSSGNPDLDPEFSDVFELGHIKYFDKGTLTSSVYYRNTNGKIDRIRSVDEQGNSITLPQNLNNEKAMGVEFTSNYNPYKWWKLDFNANFFYADIDGSNIAKSYGTSTYSWFVRQTSRFTLAPAFDMQLRGNYEAPQRTAQGKRKSLYYFDYSVSKDVFKGNGTLNLSVLDIFNTRKSRSITEGPNFYSEGTYQGRRRQLNITLNYRIKQSKPPAKSTKAGIGEEG
ncbi:MAG: TonB-dependent receptor [Chitinophagaceae bacterium]|nr:MAG: TonB-dependent receptor [Chitinophagaceae bacterium]